MALQPSSSCGQLCDSAQELSFHTSVLPSVPAHVPVRSHHLGGLQFPLLPSPWSVCHAVLPSQGLRGCNRSPNISGGLSVPVQGRGGRRSHEHIHAPTPASAAITAPMPFSDVHGLQDPHKYSRTGPLWPQKPPFKNLIPVTDHTTFPEVVGFWFHFV